MRIRSERMNKNVLGQQRMTMSGVPVLGNIADKVGGSSFLSSVFGLITIWTF